MAFNNKSYLVSCIKRYLCLRRYWNRLYSTEVQTRAASEGSDQSEIVIPYRIQRGSTDILKALQSTLKKDHTAPNYKYEDDPYFIPVSNITKRSFALSKESGKKAARYFLENYPEIFKVNTSAPLVQAFEPPVRFSESDKVTEKTLQLCIDSLDVENCLTVFERLKSEDATLKQETKQKLLELMCFYNSAVPPRQEYYEDRWYARDETTGKNIWFSDGLAETLFNEMEKDSCAYCAMIQGVTKYGHAEKAVALYEEMREKLLPATLETYNGLLTVVPAIKEDGDFRWEYAMDLVSKMNSEGLVPDLDTMNALMNIVAASRKWTKGKSIALQVLAEMDRLHIEPSPGTYYYLLLIFHRNSRAPVSILPQIMSRLDGKELEIRHPADVMFFHTAMEVCRTAESDKDLAYLVNNCVELGNNYKLLASALRESIYFKNFFRLLSYMEDFNKFMEIYDKYVPNTYTPEPLAMYDIIIALDLNGAYTHLTRLCSDVILFEQSEREDVLSELLRVTGSVKLEEKDQELLVKLIWSIVENIDRRAQNINRHRSLQWSGTLLGNVLKTFLNGNDLEKSWIVMQRLKNQEFSILGHPDAECLLAFCKHFLEAKEFQKVAFCVQYAAFTTNNITKAELQTIIDNFLENNPVDDNKSIRQQVDAILDIMPDNKESSKVAEDEEKFRTDV